jgi:hypothetical protein
MEDPEAGYLDPEAGVVNSSLSFPPPSQSATTATLATFFGGGNDSTNPIGGLFSRPAQAPKYAVVKSSVDELIDGETGSSLHVSSRLFGDGGESSAAAAAAVLASIEAASVVAPVNVDLTSTFFGGSGIVNHEIERLGLPLRVVPDLASDASRQVTLVSTSDLFTDEAVEEDENAASGAESADFIEGINFYQGEDDKVEELKPKRVIFNPGTENSEFEELLTKNNIEAIEACSLVLLRTGQY